MEKLVTEEMVKWKNWLNRKIGQMENLVKWKNWLNGRTA